MDKIKTAIANCSTARPSVTPVAARVVGSQAMGVANPDSDYDVQLLFRQSGWRYADGTEQLDQFEYEEGDVEIEAWNISKFRQLLAQTNPAAVEFLTARNNVLEADDGLLGPVSEEIRDNGNRMALYHHYLSMAGGQFQQYFENRNDPTAKRAFHVSRGIINAKYIRETNHILPLNVEMLLSKNTFSNVTLGFFSTLVKRKRRDGLEMVPSSTADALCGELRKEKGAEMQPTSERTRRPRDEVLSDFIRQAMTA